MKTTRREALKTVATAGAGSVAGLQLAQAKAIAAEFDALVDGRAVIGALPRPVLACMTPLHESVLRVLRSGRGVWWTARRIQHELHPGRSHQPPAVADIEAVAGELEFCRVVTPLGFGRNAPVKAWRITT